MGDGLLLLLDGGHAAAGVVSDGCSPLGGGCPHGGIGGRSGRAGGRMLVAALVLGAEPFALLLQNGRRLLRGGH